MESKSKIKTGKPINKLSEVRPKDNVFIFRRGKLIFYGTIKK